jgi:hypothetical protein
MDMNEEAKRLLEMKIASLPTRTREDLEKRFSFHPVNTEEVKKAHEDIRNYCKEFAFYLSVSIPEGREKSLALTHLEEVMYWCNSGIARNS